MTKCPICSGRLEAQKITYPQEYMGRLVLLENVPAEVCLQCGEILIAPEVLRKVQEIVWAKAKPRRSVTVPVYDLTEGA